MPRAFDVRARWIAPALLLAASCASPSRFLPSLPISEHTVLLTVPVVPQDELHECGLATLSALCAYHGVAIPPEERARLSAIAAREEGLSGGELREALRGLGMQAFLFRGTLDRAETGLYRHVDRGRPLLIMLAADGDEPHCCLFTGYDEPAAIVYLYDPRRGNLCLRTAEFEPLWENARRFTLLALPPPRGETPEEP